jgi:hypothetical protein
MSDKEKLHPTRPFPLHESLTNTSRKAAERPSATAAPKLMISFINFYKGTIVILVGLLKSFVILVGPL